VIDVCRISASRQYRHRDKRPALKCVSMVTFCVFLIHFSLIIAAYIFPLYSMSWGQLMVAQWLRYCATNRKVSGSIPDGVIGIFH
jgi:hypothetical protein